MKSKIYGGLASPLVSKEKSSPAKKVKAYRNCSCGRVGYRACEADKETLRAYRCTRGHVYYC
jgi:hypothetical protein